MTETTDQMSLLDAIGFSTPEVTKTPKKDKPAKAEKSDKKPSKKAAKATAEAAKDAEPASSDEAADAEVEAASAANPISVEIEAQAEAPPDLPEAASDAESLADDTLADADLPEWANDALPLDRFLCFALYSANHAMHGVYKALLKEAGLTYPQFLAMTVLWETNNVPVGAITSKLQLATNTLTPLLKRLEAMGLVTRTRNIKDERQVILKLTRKGRALQKKTEHFSSCILSSTGLKLEEVMDLQQKVMRLRDNLREAGLDA
ncbi:MarR family winged helix-turn-helix transcriptional regulator [Roseibium sp. M-1]